MGWTKALFSRLTLWSSKKSSSDSESSSSSYPPPVFAVDRTEVAVATVATSVPELTLRELNKATRFFSARMLIGRGQRGATVYRATMGIGSGKAAAVAKRLGHPPFRSLASWSASDDEFLRQQVLVLSRLRHENLLRLLGYTIDPTAGVRVLLFEFADLGTLHDALHGPTGREPPAADEASSSSGDWPALSWSQRAGIALDVARGLEYLHDAAAVSHCGVSSTNVLLFQGFRAKIADYDLFTQMPQDEDEMDYTRVLDSAEVAKAWYLPPEYVTTGRRSPKFDVFSYGVLLLELLTGRKRSCANPYLLEWAAPVVREDTVEGFMDPKLGTQYPPSRALKLATKALCCVQDNPQSRPSMGEVAEMINCYVVSSETTMAK